MDFVLTYQEENVSQVVHHQTVETLMEGIGAVLGEMRLQGLIGTLSYFDKKYVEKWVLCDEAKFSSVSNKIVPEWQNSTRLGKLCTRIRIKENEEMLREAFESHRNTEKYLHGLMTSHQKHLKIV